MAEREEECALGDRALIMANREHGVPRLADEAPAQTACTGHGCGLAVVRVQRHGDVREVAEPVHTVRGGGGHHAVIIRNKTARGDAGQMASPAHEPIRALTARCHQSLVVPYDATGAGKPTDREPAPTLTTHDRLALIVPSGGCRADAARLADREPAATLTTSESRAVAWTDEDIDACLFRMFALSEIAGAMVMDRHVDGGAYVVTGNKREAMAQYGNAVTPPVMALLVERLLEVIEAETFTDLFCGAGGSSLGAELAGGRLRLGVNHWPRAIETHSVNFEHADHDCADVSALTTRQIGRYPDSDILLASPECTNHSLAKGARRRKPRAASLWDDGPPGDEEQDRSRATMWDVWRFAEQKLLKGRPYKAIVVENVVDAFNWGPDDNGALFDAWLHAGEALGYRHRIVWLNSMFAHGPSRRLVPQSRDRLYVVWTLTGIREPNLEIQPTAWCPQCERVVPGRQTWKKPGRRVWGRYGPQYFYTCPGCHAAVLPGAAPAISIIDPGIQALPIGAQRPKQCRKCGRKHPVSCNTRERIRRGLIRLDGEPFAIRLIHGGAPRPLTVPIVTLTRRRDPAIVIPIAGNTYERTAGNRARRAGNRPLDTIHGTLDRAIVVPPMAGVDSQPAQRASSSTKPTATRAVVVMPRERRS